MRNAGLLDPNVRAIGFNEACHRYVHRYTMEHVPEWATRPAADGRYYAPQYRTDREWYENTIFPGEGYLHYHAKHCESRNQSFPMGQWLVGNPSNEVRGAT
jgi:hypothetical protein